MLEKIREAMRKSGMRQEKLSALTGVPRATLSRFLNGVGSMQGDALASIVSALGGRVVFPGDEVAGSPGGANLQARIAELERELAAANTRAEVEAARAEAYREIAMKERGATAPVAEEKRRPTTPTSIPYSRMEE